MPPLKLGFSALQTLLPTKGPTRLLSNWAVRINCVIYRFGLWIKRFSYMGVALVMDGTKNSLVFKHFGTTLLAKVN